MQRSLRVFMNGRPVATVAEPRTNKFTLTYDADATDVVSARLPWSADRYPPAAVAPWIDSIVPPEPVRRELAEQLDVPEHLLFRFLEACGADLPGAVVIGNDTDGGPTDLRTIEPDDLIDEVPVVAANGSWARPAVGSPSSHVLRPEDEVLPGSAAAEAFALRLAREAGIDAVDAELCEVAGVQAVIVTRPDRIVAGGEIERRHLETFGSLCGLALDGDDDRIYEERGGPGFAEMAEALDRFSADPQSEIRTLVDHMVLHFCAGNTNAHANTYTLLHPDRVLGPIHTLLPAEIYTELVTDEGTFDIDHRLAMTIGGRATSDDVTHGALVAEAASWPRLGRTSAESTVDAAIDRIAEAVPAAITAVPTAPETLTRLITDRLERLRAGR